MASLKLGGRTLAGGALVIHDELGAGGMGMVWRGTQTTLDRPVAVKFLRMSRLADDERDGAIHRLLDEAKAASRLRHPALVELLDAGVDDELGPYLVYELLPGRNLRTHLDEVGCMAWEDFWTRVGSPVLDGLGCLHSSGIIHRDLKPDNVLSDAEGHFKLGDFGLALFSGRSAKTATGTFFGTPGYLAPEGITSAAAAITPASDLYSFAVLAVVAVTGGLPFAGSASVEILRSQLKQTVEPSALVDAGVPIGAAEVLARTLQRDPTLRPPSAAALRSELSEAGAATRAVASPATRPRRGPGRPRLARPSQAGPRGPKIPSAMVLSVAEAPVEGSGMVKGRGTRRRVRLLPAALFAGLLLVLGLVALHRSGGLRTATSRPPAAPNPTVAAPPVDQSALRLERARQAALAEGEWDGLVAALEEARLGALSDDERHDLLRELARALIRAHGAFLERVRRGLTPRNELSDRPGRALATVQELLGGASPSDGDLDLLLTALAVVGTPGARQQFLAAAEGRLNRPGGAEDCSPELLDRVCELAIYAFDVVLADLERCAGWLERRLALPLSDDERVLLTVRLATILAKTPMEGRRNPDDVARALELTTRSVALPCSPPLRALAVVGQAWLTYRSDERDESWRLVTSVDEAQVPPRHRWWYQRARAGVATTRGDRVVSRAAIGRAFELAGPEFHHYLQICEGGVLAAGMSFEALLGN